MAYVFPLGHLYHPYTLPSHIEIPFPISILPSVLHKIAIYLYIYVVSNKGTGLRAVINYLDHLKDHCV